MFMSAQDYRESLRGYQPNVYVKGQKIESVADEPLLQPGINAIGLSGIDGRIIAARRKDSIRVVENGPVKTVVVAEGAHRSESGERLFDWRLRMTAFRGKSFLIAGRRTYSSGHMFPVWRSCTR